jgi:hypothetical protein
MAQSLEQLLAIAGLAHHQQVFGQADQLLDAFAHDGVVFSDKYTDHNGHSSKMRAQYLMPKAP